MKRLLMIGMLLLASLSVKADDVTTATNVDESGFALLKLCTWSDRSYSTYEIGYCHGRIASTMMLMNILSDTFKACIPTSLVSVGEGRLVVIKFLKANPDLLAKDDQFLIMVALREAWPCPKN